MDDFLVTMAVALVAFVMGMILLIIGEVSGESKAMEEAFKRGYAVECLGEIGYHWECEGDIK